VDSTGISRRAFLLSPVALAGCGPHKASGISAFCFVADAAGRALTVIDLSRFRPRKTIVLDDAPAQVVAHKGYRKVYALAPETGTIYEIDAVRLAVARRTRAGNLAESMRLSADGRALWVLYRDPAILVELPLDSFQPARRIRLQGTPGGFDVSSTGIAAVACPKERIVELASLAGGTVDRTIETGDEPSLLRFQSDSRQLIVGSGPARSLGIFQTATGRVVVRLPLPLEPRHFAFNSDGGQLFVSGEGMDAVVTVYPYRTEVAETMLAGHAPAGMAVTDNPAFLLVANPDSDTVTVLDFDNPGKKLVAMVQVGREPRHIVITPDNQFALVLNEGSGDVAVIRMYTLAKLDSVRRRHPTPVFNLIPAGQKPVAAAVLALS
jgi:DNA-binding beta-propeller fold protein YncE